MGGHALLQGIFLIQGLNLYLLGLLHWQVASVADSLKEESEKVGLKLNIQKTRIMATSPITSWQTGGETVETMADFIFCDS